MEQTSLYFIGGTIFLIGLWKVLYGYWKSETFKIVKDREREYMQKLAGQILEAKGIDENKRK